MQQVTELKQQLLLAMPQLQDSWFERSVIYICQHDEYGAMGITLTKSSNLTLGDIYDQLDIDAACGQRSEVLNGGPVQQEHGFILHKQQGDWQSTLQLADDLFLTTSKDIIGAIAEGRGPNIYKVALGYAGWDKDQLEQELSDNSWLTLKADEKLLFNTEREELYSQALAKLGVNESFLSSEAGHA